MSVGSKVGARASVRTDFALAKLLLELWRRYDAGQPCELHTMHTVQVDGARGLHYGIPSFTR